MITKAELKAYSLHERRISHNDLVKKFLAEDPHCCYCGIEVKEYPELRARDLKRKERYPDDMATIEHVYDKFDLRRYQIYHNFENKKLACFKCNHTKGQDKVSSLPRSYLNKRDALAKQRVKHGIPRPILFQKLEVDK